MTLVSLKQVILYYTITFVSIGIWLGDSKQHQGLKNQIPFNADVGKSWETFSLGEQKWAYMSKPILQCYNDT